MPHNASVKSHKDQKSIFQWNYYRERHGKTSKIKIKKTQQKIDEYMSKHAQLPPSGVARESGYSQLVFEGTHVEINRSMLDTEEIEKGEAWLLKKKTESQLPLLPVSCIASTEHIIAMNHEVQNFESEYLPESKKKVTYQLLVKIDSNSMNNNDLLKIICEEDDILTASDIAISYCTQRNVFVIELPTQLVDIQDVVDRINQVKKLHIVDCNFDDIALNEGICLVKRDASNPIHALANIAQGIDKKGNASRFFLERDAGKTTGKCVKNYQDNNWLFNCFRSGDELKKNTFYPADAYMVKIHKP